MEANPPQTYEEKKAAVRNRNIALALAGRDIGDLPEVANQEQKEACQRDFRLFCETYFPEAFYLPWSPDHLKAIARIETAVLEGGLFALAMPRASGKALALDTPLATPDGWTTMGGRKLVTCLMSAVNSAVLMKSQCLLVMTAIRTFSDGKHYFDAGICGRWRTSLAGKTLCPHDEWLVERYSIGKRDGGSVFGAHGRTFANQQQLCLYLLMRWRLAR